MKKVSVIAAAVAATLAAGSAFAVDFNGYFRAGTGISGNGEADVSYFDKRGVGRLGNENDNYYEFGFAEELKTGEQTWRVESMIAQGNEGANGWEDGDFNVAQFAVKAKGVLGFDNDATLWAGKTYYQRKDIHISDFYFLDTSGTGGGIENISIGDQKLSVALIQDGEDDNGSGYKFDVRLANIGLWDQATLELAALYNFSTEKDDKTIDGDNGVLATAIISQGLSNGFNQTVLQYGTAGYGVQAANFWGAGSYYDRTGNENDGSGFRILNWGVMNLADNIEMGHQLAYLSGSDLGANKIDSSQYSIVVRPMYKWNDTMRTIFEGGYNAGEVDNEDFGGAKLTLAQAWAMGDSWWARPEIRVYGSYFMDLENDDAFGKGEDTEYVVGIQAEAWW
ncbi:Maltoporin [Vibrio harveyi]|uniref:Maltoporin LamB n=2 Tax=Vibrio parahaemolyticus TaxID=670 RepID=A0A9Q3UDK2_VIBPH|nr:MULTISPECIES: maltoporin LamB [Vibrio harveyi group]BDP36861.1 maltoporin [Vibrio alginolyticus]EIN4363838.1 maltoporin LamB [Vibrio parahaemolyticus]EIO3213489.1 maltoporin LamB [Vibrio parahaemolyticus]EJB8435546.1 maltoporin LamB [Vibrio parahaemolyticus]EJB8446049.1 maltoporin LamB [Vibrio parahaemolyticus]